MCWRCTVRSLSHDLSAHTVITFTLYVWRRFVYRQQRYQGNISFSSLLYCCYQPISSQYLVVMASPSADTLRIKGTEH